MKTMKAKIRCTKCNGIFLNDFRFDEHIKICNPMKPERSKHWLTMVDILEGEFPKGECKERGSAIVMLAYIDMMLRGTKFDENGKPMKKEEWKLSEQYGRDMHPGLFKEAICPHGIGHHKGVHGCDGCCKDMPKEILDKVSED